MNLLIALRAVLDNYVTGRNFRKLIAPKLLGQNGSNFGKKSFVVHIRPIEIKNIQLKNQSMLRAYSWYHDSISAMSIFFLSATYNSINFFT